MKALEASLAHVMEVVSIQGMPFHRVRAAFARSYFRKHARGEAWGHTECLTDGTNQVLHLQVNAENEGDTGDDTCDSRPNFIMTLSCVR